MHLLLFTYLNIGCSLEVVKIFVQLSYLLGSTEYLEPSNSFEDTSNSLAMVALAFYDGLWAYDGW